MIERFVWRCHTGVTTRTVPEWAFKITAYADELLRDLDQLGAWPERVVAMQRHWIGRSTGARIRFAVGSRGIDVFTTLNIQHVESLNDVVAQITQIRVRETVPDSILDRADDIEIVDLSPDDLIEIWHRARGRDGFARGAVFAAEMLRGRKGFFRFDELVMS